MLDNMYKHFALPFSLIVIGMYVVLSQPSFLFKYSIIVELLPYGVLLIVIAVSALLMQFEHFYQSLVVFLLYLTIQLHMQVAMDNGETYLSFLSVNLYWPFLILYLHSVRDRSLKSTSAVIAMVAIGALLILPIIAQYFIDQEQLLVNIPVGLLGLVKADSVFPVGLFVSYICATVFMGVLYVLWPTHTKANWLLIIGLMVFLFINLRMPFISSILSLTLALVLLSGLMREAFYLAYIDELTKIPSRKALQKHLNSLGRSYSIAMLDVDHFKKFNDTHGHDVGDQVLMLVATKINQVKGGGKAYRYGGEEFTIVFSGKNSDEVAPYLNEVRESIMNYKIALRSNSRPKDNEKGKQGRGSKAERNVGVTISMGVANYINGSKPEDVLKNADTALYKAKSSGRNCVKQFG